MNAEQHLEKARRILKCLGGLDAAADAYAIIDGALIAGYHLGNAILHAHDVSEPSVHFNTASKLERPLETLPLTVQPAFRFFAELETIRSEYVRGSSPPDERAVLQARRALAGMAKHCGIDH